MPSPSRKLGPLPRWLVLAGVLSVVVGALLAVLLAAGTAYVACDSGPSEACDRESLATAQLVVALVGLLAVGGLCSAVWRDKRRPAVAWLAVAVAVYLVWGVLTDAAVNGWDDLEVFGSAQEADTLT